MEEKKAIIAKAKDLGTLGPVFLNLKKRDEVIISLNMDNGKTKVLRIKVLGVSEVKTPKEE